MRFLLRMAFWLTVVLCLLPSGGSQTAQMQFSASEAMSAARATVSDMRGFCERQAGACAVGSQAAVAIGQRAQAGAKVLYEFLNERFGPNAEQFAPRETGAVSASGVQAVPLPAARPSQNTLTPADLKPSWRGPQPGDRPA